MASEKVSQSQPAHYTTKESHPVLESYKRVSNKLEQEHSRVQNNQSKIQALEKKISCLALLNRSSEK